MIYDLSTLDNLYKTNVLTLSDIRLILWVQDNDLDLKLTIELMDIYNNEQIRELICIKDYWPKIEKFVKKEYSPRILGLIRDISYSGHCPDAFNFDVIRDVDIWIVRKNLKLTNLMDKIYNEELELFDETAEDIDIEEILSESKMEFENIEDLLSIFEDKYVEPIMSEFIGDKNNEVSDEEYFYYGSTYNYKEYVEDKIKRNAILINKNDELVIYDNIALPEYYERFFNGNIRLALHYANRYKNIVHESHHADIIQSALLGVINAMDKFDNSLKFRFSTYAYWHIHQQIRRYIHNNISIIRIPVHKREELYKIETYKRDYCLENMEQISNKMILKYYPSDNLEGLEENLLYLNQTINIDDLSLEQIDFLELKHSHNKVLDYSSKKVLEHEIHLALLKLDSREQKVIKLRFGLDGKGDKTLEEVGKLFGVTRERIRQIEVKALRKLKHPANSKRLKDFL